MQKLAEKSFWESDEVHVALPPGVAGDGLCAYATLLRLGGCCLFQTSGSEGRPKWVLLTKTAMLASARGVCDHLRVNSSDRWLLTLPQWHVGGFSLWSRAFVSGSVVIEATASKWSPAGFAADVEKNRITLTSLVPAQVVDLVREGLRSPSSLRAVVVGGGRLEPEWGTRARELGWPVLQSYGMTEAASQVATEPLEHLNTGYDPDAMIVLPHWQTHTEEGRLVIRGPALAAGHIHQAENGQWNWEPIGDHFITRDQVELVQRGGHTRLRFIGREAHMLKILGELVHLGALQAKLSQICTDNGHTNLAVLIAEPDERRGHTLVMRYNRQQLTPAAAEQLRATFDHTPGIRPFERIQRLHAVDGPVINEMGKMKQA